MDTKELKKKVRQFMKIFEKNSEILETLDGKTFEVPTKFRNWCFLMRML